MALKTNDFPVLPANYMSWREIGRLENQNIERLENTVRDTHSRLMSLRHIKGFRTLKEFAAYYNTYANELITDKQYNQFYSHGRLEPIAHLIKYFVVDRVTRNGDIMPICDFGILKSHYQYYKKNGRPPKVENRGRIKTQFNNDGSRTKVEFTGGGSVDIPKNDVWKRFTDGINAANENSTHRVSIVQMVVMALQMFMESRPDVFLPVEMSVTAETRKRNNDRVFVDISPSLRKKMNDTIQRYNSANIMPITQSRFIESAIKSMIERLPVELVDPELAKKLAESDKK